MRKRVYSEPVPAERELAVTWARTSGAVTLADGERVEVIYPGHPNPEAGPDFVGAVLATEAGEVRGAVELHRRTSDWQRHGHGADPAYAGVVLHVVGRHDGAASRRPGGESLPLLELLAGTAKRGAAELGTGGADGMPSFPCARRTLAGADLIPALAEAGAARFRANAARFGAALAMATEDEVAEQVAYEAIAEALGYSRNMLPMRALAQAAPLADVRRVAGGILAGTAEGATEHASGGSTARVEALVLGTAGLLPSQRHLRQARRRDAYVETLERLWAEQRAEGRQAALRAYAWDASRVRPENAPVRRVVALAHLARRWPLEGLLNRLRAVDRTAPLTLRRTLAALVVLPCPPGYWAQHWDFGVPARAGSNAAGSGQMGRVRGARRRSSASDAIAPGSVESAEVVALIGPARAADVVINVLLPLMAALGECAGDTALVQAAAAAYHAHPVLAENWITRLVRERTGLLPALGTPDPVRTAAAQQGLIAVYEGPCRDLRCTECPLKGQMVAAIE